MGREAQGTGGIWCFSPVSEVRGGSRVLKGGFREEGGEGGEWVRKRERGVGRVVMDRDGMVRGFQGGFGEVLEGVDREVLEEREWGGFRGEKNGVKEREEERRGREGRLRSYKEGSGLSDVLGKEGVVRGRRGGRRRVEGEGGRGRGQDRPAEAWGSNIDSRVKLKQLFKS